MIDKSKNQTQPTSEPSLQPSPETYVDRQSESKILKNRICSSQSSVTGICGERGSGKSSLAMRVLKDVDNNGAFSVLIPAPTACEPRDLILMLFQRICEDVIERVDLLFGQRSSLEETARRSHSNSQRLETTIGIGILTFVVVLIAIWGSHYWNESQFKQREIQEQEIKEHSALRLNALNALHSKGIISDRLLTLMGDGSLRSEALETEVGFAIQRSIGVAKEISNTENPDESIDSVRERVIEKYSQKIDIKQLEKIVQLAYQNRDGFVDAQSGFYSYNLLTTVLKWNKKKWFEDIPIRKIVPTLSFALVCNVLVLYWPRFVRKRRLNQLIMTYSKEYGLKLLSEEHLERLQFQSSVTKSYGFDWSIIGLTSKTARSKTMTTTPLSTPSLCDLYCDFLIQVGEVYSGRVVICLDELDKIQDPNELDNLLSGIKGVLGCHSTHYLLTVSEDCLTRFSLRHRMERGIIESSFENIILLNRVDSTLGRKIIAEMCEWGNEREEETFLRNALVVWTFGRGIPRDIKRVSLLCREADISLADIEPIALWITCMKWYIDESISWTSQFSVDEFSASTLLVILSRIRCDLTSNLLRNADLEGWFDTICVDLKSFLDSNSMFESDREPTGVVQLELGQKSTARRDWIRAILELVVVLGSYRFANWGDAVLTEEYQARLLEIFRFLPKNSVYSERICWDFFQPAQNQ